jgi:CspA family cold shock protein
MAVGTVKWFSAPKGFGFITTPDVSGDVFVHFTAIAMSGFKTLEPNAQVEFELVATGKGFMAQQVRVLDAEGHANLLAA